MNKYKFESENTTKYTDWHDSFCKKFYKKDDKWILEIPDINFEFNHPENPYDTGYQTDDCIVEFEDPVIIDYSVQTYNEDFNFIINENINLNKLNLYSYYETYLNNTYKYASIDFMTLKNDYISIEFLFKKSLLKWNELTDTSWIGANKRKYEIIKMLSEYNSEEVQQKGIELAKNTYIGHLIQPCVDGETKSLWENCAKAISERTDDELKLWLLPCSFWLQDMNHPGAEIIAERLKAFFSKEKLMQEKRKAIKIAEIIGDEEWLDNLKEWL